jgi:two-component system, cell cycle sensor histidine kinase and response regulator CckA
MALDLLNRMQVGSGSLNPSGQVKSLVNCSDPEIVPGIGSDISAAGPRGGPQTILLVEDEAFVRKVTAEVLESAGYRLVIARNAAEALETYRGFSTPPDLLLSDVVMPGMSGGELARELQNLCPHPRVLLMSGYVEKLSRSDLSPTDSEYLAKPFSIQTLLRRVREALDKPFDGVRT